jgi:Halobacterial output domain 1
MPNTTRSHSEPSLRTSPTDTESITTAVVTAVTEATGTKPTTPLYKAIDPDALESLYQHAAPTVRFKYAGQHVTIAPDRTVTVSEL